MDPLTRDPFDPVGLTATSDDVARISAAKLAKKKAEAGAAKAARGAKDNRRFIAEKRWRWACAAAKLPGKAAIVGDGIWLLRGLEKSDTFKWRPSIGAELGLTYHTFYRGLTALEAAGLVSVERRCGRSPIITLIRDPKET